MSSSVSARRTSSRKSLIELPSLERFGDQRRFAAAREHLAGAAPMNETEVASQPDQLGGGPQAQFPVNAVKVRVDRLARDAELVRDLAGQQAVRCEAKHLALANR